MKKYQLQKKDTLILNEICNNARLSYNQIARATKISKDSVKDRINKMEKEKYILSYFPLINYNKLNLKLFHVYIRILPSEKPDKIFLAKALDCPEIASITWIAGKYDLELQVVCKNKKETLKKIRELIPGHKLKEILILRSEKLEVYTMGINSQSKEKLIETNDRKVNLEKKDIQLIELLAKNGRIRIIDLAEKLDLEEYQIRYKIKKFLEEKVILGFYTRTNKHRCGFNSYIMLLKTKKPLNKRHIEELKKINNIYYLKSCTGKYNSIIRFQSRDNKELITAILSIRKTLDNEIKNFEIFSLLERQKFLPLKIK